MQGETKLLVRCDIGRYADVERMQSTVQVNLNIFYHLIMYQPNNTERQKLDKLLDSIVGSHITSSKVASTLQVTCFVFDQFQSR